MKKTILLILVIITLGAAGYFALNEQDSATVATTRPDEVTITTDEVEDPVVLLPKFDKTQFSLDDSTSIWLVVNKERAISIDYIPEDLRTVAVNKRIDKSADELKLRDEVATALEAMFLAASQSSDLDLLLGSGYRSASLQAYYYNNYVKAYGQEEADKFSAKPGTSEHQTGMAADLAGPSSDCYLEPCFAETAEGDWLAKEAHKFGFTVRYPEGKDDITGYQYEPWHMRYVGIELATELYDNNQTLEEFFDL